MAALAIPRAFFHKLRLLQGVFDLRDALVDILEFRPHAVIGARMPRALPVASVTVSLSLILSAYLSELGFSQFQIGIIASAALLGTAVRQPSVAA